MVRDHEASPERIGPIVEELLVDRPRLSSMSSAARRVGHPDAADALAAWVLELASG
jgi:UDP-N-acetylglucosamine:LPS N-acetylglucosamine transferase